MYINVALGKSPSTSISQRGYHVDRRQPHAANAQYVILRYLGIQLVTRIRDECTVPARMLGRLWSQAVPTADEDVIHHMLRSL